MPLYFAYGSNMDVAGMARRCPGARPLAPAWLMRHRLAFLREGFATVVRDPGATVWGLLWDLPLRAIPALDRYEEVASGLYAKLQQAVLTATGPRRALVYVGRGEALGAPRPDQLALILDAARALGLPTSYQRALTAFQPRARSA